MILFQKDNIPREPMCEILNFFILFKGKIILYCWGLIVYLVPSLFDWQIFKIIPCVNHTNFDMESTQCSCIVEPLAGY